MVAGFTTARPVTDELIHDVLTRQLVKHNETDIPVSDVLGIVCVILGDNFHAVIEPEVENVWPTFSN